MTKISEFVADMEKEIESYKTIISDCCIVIDEKEFLRHIESFKYIGLNSVLSRCPFPYSCNHFETCTETCCNCNTCDNGYAYRGS